MLKAIEQLVKGQRTNVGNHRRREYTDSRGNVMEDFIYFNTAICKVNHSQCKYLIDKGGYDTPSTNRAVNDYRFYFQSRDYAQVFENFYSLMEYMTLQSTVTGHMYRCFYGIFHNPMYCVTLTTKLVDGEKFAEVNISNCFNGSVTEHSFKYKGYKTFMKEFEKLEEYLSD